MLQKHTVHKKGKFILNTWEVLTGFILGIFASAIVAAFWPKLFLPSIKFSDKISKKESTDNNEIFCYRIKFRNDGKRDIFELNIYSSIILCDFPHKGSRHIVEIKTSYCFNPIFKKRNFGKETNPDAVVKFVLNNNELIQELSRPIYPESIKSKAVNGQITLEDILSISPNSYIKVFITAHDSFTGNKKIFESKKYTEKDIKFGVYKIGDLEIFEKNKI